MTDIYKKSELTRLLEKHGFRVSKSLGQNFLTDKNIIDKIVDALDVTSDDTVVEIGPGVGALTSQLSEIAGEVKSIEIDKKVIPLLNEVLGPESNNVQIINEDFMKADLNSITGGRPYKLIGNLPYYITTPIIMKVLEEGPKPTSMVFMIQKEVAERLSAKPGKKDYGAITVAAGYYCKVEYCFTVSSQVFVPKPKVDSAVIKLSPFDAPPVSVQDEKMFFSVVRAGFGQRRKTLNNSLRQIDGITAEQVRSALDNAEIDYMRRAETLDINEFARLSDSVTAILNNKS